MFWKRKPKGLREQMAHLRSDAIKEAVKEGWDIVCPINGEYPDEPFFNMIIEQYGKPPYLKFMMGNGYGCSTFDEWRDMINKNPEQWKVYGNPGEFQFVNIGGK